MKMRTTWPAVVAIFTATLGVLGLQAADPSATGPLVIIDAAGKEHKIKAWRFVQGTRHLTWLAPAPPPARDEGEVKAPQRGPARPAIGPEALEFRDDDSTDFVEGVLTLIPLQHLRAVEYDYEKETAKAVVAVGEKADSDEVYSGTTKFRGINKLTIEAEVDKGELGVAEIKFLGGSPRGLRAVRFPTPKPAPEVKGRLAAVTVADKGKKNVQKVVDLQALYRMPDGTERRLPTLLFKKTLKVDVAKIERLTASEGRDADGSEWDVKLKDGEENTLTLLKAPMVEGKPALLLGLLGQVRGGYKLFPVHTVAAVQFDEEK